MTGRWTAQRYGWTFVDQGISSITNFVVAALAARQLSQVGFGEFSLAFALYLVLLSLARSWTSEPLTVRFSGTEREAVARATSAALGLALIGGLTGGLVLASAHPLVVGRTSATLVVLGLFLPFLLGQDVLRMSMIVANRARSAAVNDTLWLGVSVALLVVIGPDLTPALAMSCWVVGAAIAMVFGALQLGLRRLASPVAWGRTHSDLGWRYSLEHLASSSTGHLLTLVIGAIAGVAAAGGLRGAQVLLGPLSVFFAALLLASVPHLASLRDEPARAFRISIHLSVLFTGVAVVAGVGILLIPDQLGQEILGESWSSAREVLPWYVLTWIALGLSGGAIVGLRALGFANRSLGVRVPTSVGIVVLVSIGAAIGGLEDALAAMAAGQALAAIAWWWVWTNSRQRAKDAHTGP